MLPQLIALLALLLLTGCSAVQMDLQGAAIRATAAQSAGILSPSDPLVPCLKYWQGSLAAGGPIDILKPPFAGLIDLGVDAYILDSLVASGASSDALDSMCGPVANKIIKNIGRRAPGVL